MSDFFIVNQLAKYLGVNPLERKVNPLTSQKATGD